MVRGNVYFSKNEVELLIAAVDSMLEALPTVDNVPAIDQADALRDRADYEQLRVKLEGMR